MILAVDRNQRNLDLLTDLLSKKGYETRGAVTLEEFDGALEGERDISLALVDVAGFDPAIWQRCDRLREARIPFLVISARRLTHVEEASLAHGARNVLVKPLVVERLLGVVRGLLGR